MNRWKLLATVLAGFVVMGLFSVLTIVNDRAVVQAKPAEAPNVGEGGLPIFEKDPNWPQVPAKWRLGSVSQAAVDAKDNIWIIHRPGTLKPEQRKDAAPSVLEFDNSGKFLQAWGGPGAGYEWVGTEHSLFIDYKGFVWIVGSGAKDGQILKFTQDGKFVAQFGKSGQTGDSNSPYLNKPNAIWLYPKTNELFVSDGYGNRRIVVLDPETGKIKRYWGAYGRKPIDIGPPIGEGANAPTASSIHFYPQDPWRAYAENLQQFDTPHDVKVSNDGLVYVADRANKRVQVFTVDGKYVTQQFVGVDQVKYLTASPECAKPPCHEPDLQSRSVAFSPDPQQRFLYVSGLVEVNVLNRKTMQILGTIPTGEVQEHPPNHEITIDRMGNLYTPQSGVAGGGALGKAQIMKWVLKGYTPPTKNPS